MTTRFLVFIFILSIFSLESSLAQPSIDRYLCNVYNYTKGSVLDENVHKVFKTLGANSSRAMYGSDKQGNGNTTVYGQFNCRGDISIQECNNCTQDAVLQIQNVCGDSVGKKIWLDTCFLRYETYDFFGKLDLSGKEIRNVKNALFSTAFANAVQELLTDLSYNTTASTLRYASGSVMQGSNPIYGLVQCWIVLSDDDCKRCLSDSLDWIKRDVSGYEGARILKGSCMARYEIYRFYKANSTKSAPTTNNKRILPIKGNSTLSAPTAKNKGNSTQSAHTTKNKGYNFAVILAVVGSSLALLFLALWLCSICRSSKRLKRLVKKDESFLDRDTQITFTMEELIVATNNFDEKLKLGEGGFGVVYKGHLYNGKEIAVKRLSLKSSQGMQEFMAEIRLLANIQHKNLVSLLGCCKEANHLILVYEYLSNQSLDNFIFDSDSHNRELLNWVQRYNIILGITRGLLYLHEDSKLKIIHRDIKASNILLDERFNPKIADFGLARLFDEDETQVHTVQVAGTKGYMAPEYVLHGLVSAKADVYSFGVLVLEIIGGRKNIDLRAALDTQNLVEWTWKLHQQGSISEMIDEIMRDACNHDQVARCIHLALLCTQDDSSLRPTMSEVLLMLSSHVDVSKLSNPSTPKLLNVSCSEASSSTGDHSFLPSSSKSQKNLISSHYP